MRLFLQFSTASIPRGDGAYDRPPALVNVNVLNFNVLLTLAAVTVEGFGQRCEGPGELVRLVQVLASSFEGLLSNHRTPVTLHGGVMDRDQLPDQHSLVLVSRLHALHGSERRLPLLRALIGIGILQPQSGEDLMSEDVEEIVVVGAADRP
jgi:hypothetical protein